MLETEQHDSCQRRLVLPLHDNAVLKRILDTHGPENIEFKMSPIIKVIENIMHKSIQSPDTESEEPTFKKEDIESMHKSIPFKISVISCEVLGSCYRTEDILETTLSMFTALSSFSWTAKAVVALAAFAVNYGHFRLVVEGQNQDDDYPTVVAFLEQVPEEMCTTPLYKDIKDLAEALLRLTWTTWKLRYFYPKFINPGAQVLTELNEKLPTIISWIIQSIAVCQSLITNLAHTGYEYMSSSAEEWELSCLKQTVTSFYKDFEIDAANELARHFSKDNITVLKDVICSEEYMNMPLVVGAKEKQHEKPKFFQADEVLEKKRVLLYISAVDVEDAEIRAVQRIHDVVEESQMVLVWLPVLDNPNDWKKNENGAKLHNAELFKRKRDLMPWIVVRKPQYLDPTSIAFIKNMWEFQKKSKIMVFDSEGRLEMKDALPMILVWGSYAYPFTTSKEEDLFTSEKTWKLEFLLPYSTQLDLDLRIEEDKYICLFGGEDVNWIQDFTDKVREVVSDSRIDMKMLFMGTSNPRKTEETSKEIGEINGKAIVVDKRLIWLFWARMDAMYNYCLQRGMSLGEKDSGNPVFEGLVTMRSFDKSRRSWAIVCKGSDNMARAFADVMLKCFDEYENGWKRDVKKEEGDFMEALKSRIWQNCETLYLPLPSAGLPEKRICNVCRRVMRKSYTFSCWGNEDTNN